jgi:pimeloyl-ACP methyl ester carboxylesterase
MPMNAGRVPVGWQTEHLVVEGVRIACFTAGSAAHDAPVVLLLHGLGHWTAGAWDRLAPQLDPGYRIVAIDLPGFGASERPDAPYDLPFFRAILAGVAAQRLPPRFAVVGHSLGGMIAADFSGAFSERVARLALIAPAGFDSAVIVDVLGGPFAQPLFRLRPVRAFVRWTLRTAVVHGDAIDEATVARACALVDDPGVRRAFARVYRSAVPLMHNGAALHRAFARYTGPVFIAWGRQDRYVAFRGVQNSRRVYPQAVVKIFEDSGHVVMLDEPERLGTALRTFLA